MAVTAEQLNIILAARDREFTRAMDQNTKRIQRFSQQANKNLSATGKSFNSLGVAAKRIAPILLAAFSARAIQSSAAFGKEISNLARLSGTSVEQFQSLAYGARTVGIEADKLSDIFKDMQDRVGDFMQTGGGPMADFFENIAPKVGITADNFRGLSGPDALQLFVKSLQDANLSASDMTFYMEAMASDATLLLPLLQDNGAAFKQLGDEAKKSGRILSKDQIENLVKLDRQISILTNGINTEFNLALADNAEELSNIAEFINETVIPAMGGLLGIVGQVARAFNSASDEFKVMAEQAGPGMRNLKDLLDAYIEEEFTNKGMMLPSQIIPPSPNLTALETGATKDSIVGQVRAVLGYDPDTYSSPEKPASTPAIAPGLTKAQQERYDAAKEAFRQLSGSLSEAVKIQNEFEAGQQVVNEALATGAISSTQQKEAIALLTAQMNDAKFEMSDMASVAKVFEDGMTSAFMSLLDGTASAKDAFRSMARDVIRELYRVLVVQQLVGSFSSDGGGIAGSIYSAFSGRASGGPVTSGQPYMVGESGRELFVPNSNGRVLSASQTRNVGSSGGVVVQQTINVTTGVQQTVRAEIKTLLPQIAEASRNAVLDARMRGGSYGRAFA